MLKSVTIRSTLVAVACLMSFSVQAMANSVERIDIPRGQLTTALQILAKQTGTEFIYSSEQLKDIQTQGAHGTYTTEQAVTQLLRGTKLHLTTHASGAFLISDNSAESEQKSAGADRFRLAQAPRGAGSTENNSSAAAPASEEQGGLRLEEIVVTAQKREERLLDVPVPITAVLATNLTDSNQLRLQDYYNRIPGLNVSPSTQGAQFISIRGVTTGPGNPTVGIVVDDVPYGGSTSIGSGMVVPDFDPSDLSHIEVLRGPQGTLYGVGGLGGLIKYVTADPSTAGVSGRLETGVNGVKNGDGLGYDARGSINLPLSDDLAIRASGSYRRDPGYVDDPALDLKGVNEGQTFGGRVAALWRPSTDFSIKLSALYQRNKTDGSSDVYPSLPTELSQSFALPGMGAHDIKSQAYSATINARLGAVKLVSLTGYNILRYTDTEDLTSSLGAFGPVLFGAGFTAAPFYEDSETKKFSQELRASVSFGEHVDWLIGGFYTHEGAVRHQSVIAVNPLTGAGGGSYLGLNSPSTYQEFAAFTDVTLHFSDRFDMQFGGREAYNDQDYSSDRTGALQSPSAPQRSSSANKFTFLVTPDFKLSQDAMLYVRVASGYQAGGPNNAASLTAGVPPSYGASTTINYELGAKGRIGGQLLTYDVSLYYIDWQDIQLTLQSSLGSYMANGSHAESKGIEATLELHPLQGLTISTWGSVGKADLTEALPATSTAYGADGARLPFSSEFSGRFSVDQQFPLGPNVTADLGAAVSHVGNEYGILRGVSVGVPLSRQIYSPYTRLDLTAGLDFGSWNLALFVNNLTDRRAAIAGGLGEPNPLAFTYISPRSVGMNVAYKY